MQVEDYIKAGKIAAEVRENVRKKNWIGITLEDICEEVENEILKRGAKLAFPVNTSLNEVAAHYTAEPNDQKTVTDTDLIKIDLGAQINGYIADTAVTVCYDPQYDGLIQAAEDALQNAISIIKNDEADKLQEYIWTNFNMLPFALRWLVKDWEEKKARELLEILIKKKVVHAYPILVEANGQRVSQAEHTFIPTETGVTVTTTF